MDLFEVLYKAYMKTLAESDQKSPYMGRVEMKKELANALEKAINSEQRKLFTDYVYAQEAADELTQFYCFRKGFYLGLHLLDKESRP